MKSFYITTLIFLIIPSISFAQGLYFDPVHKYTNAEIVEILIVPGHDDENPGAVFRGMKEADMNLLLSQKIAKELRKDSRIFVTVSRDENGFYPPLLDYLNDNEKEINKFIDDSKEDTKDFLKKNNIVVEAGVTHNNAPTEVAFGLYGINRWIAEESFDLVLHVHFNDDTSHWGNNMGQYGGYTVYVPERNLLNYEKTLPFAKSIATQMQKTFWKTNLPIESERADELGLVEDFKLIALGSNRTLSVPSILVEYSYIYEPHVKKEFIDLSSSIMAKATSNGIFNLLSNNVLNSKNLIYEWDKSLGLSNKKDLDTLALQFGLRELGLYPPKNHHRDNCPFTGIYGPCTQKAVKEFQRANGLVDDGIAGVKTLSILNSMF